VANQLGHHGGWLNKIELGDRQPSLSGLMKLAAALNARACDLVTGPVPETCFAGLAPVPATDGMDLPWTAAGSLAAIRVVAEGDGDQVDRRDFLAVTGAALTVPAARWVNSPALPDVARAAGSMRVTEAVVDGLDRTTEVIRRTGSELGGGTALSLAQRHLRECERLLGDGSYDDTTGCRLLAVTAEVLRLAGWLAHDSCAYALAQRYWLAGLRAAHAGGDRAVGANILCFMSDQAGSTGSPHDALRLAQAARRGYPGGSSRVDALVELHLARACSYVGDAHGTRRSLDRAVELVDDSGECPPWATWIDQGTVHAFAGSCYRRLRSWDLAETHLLAGFQAPGYLSTPIEQADHRRRLAEVYVRRPNPDLDRAAELGNEAVDWLAGQVNSPKVVSRMRELVSVLPHDRHNPLVRTLRERVQSLARAS
jgi:hypothetical protein